MWSPAASISDNSIANPLAFPTTNTTYNVTVTDSNGCTTADSIVVTVNDTLLANATATVMNDGKAVRLTGSATGGNSNFNYTWEGLGNSSSYVVIPWGEMTYHLQVMDSNGCIGTDTITINLGKPTCNCNAEPQVYYRYVPYWCEVGKWLFCYRYNPKMQKPPTTFPRDRIP